MAIILRTEDPGVKGVRKAVKEYVKRYPDYADALGMYGSIMEAQQEALQEVASPPRPSAGEIEGRLKEGTPLIEPRDLEIDPALFREVAGRICRIVEGRPDGFTHCDDILSWDGLDDEGFTVTRDLVLAGEGLEIGLEWRSDSDREITSNVLWEGLVPFYRKYSSICESEVDHSYWQRGFCPICGSPPLIGMFRPGDGLWVLECSLCHTLWNVIRARCPFCDKGVEGSLSYLYIDEDRLNRVQYCESCRYYVKTLDLRDSERGGLLPLEDIVTVRLDLAAKKEGLKPAPGFPGKVPAAS
ncbi:MAG: formate dehydrogenase accessory protein FdhE [Actinomycetia bacterium]|nr:formate dehydrogenase accessory protein FdhE [Actinomycetes bacterium]